MLKVKKKGQLSKNWKNKYLRTCKKSKKPLKVKGKDTVIDTKNLEKIYYNIKDVDSYTSVERLRKRTKIAQKDINKWLNSEIAYSLNKPLKKDSVLERIKSALQTIYGKST